MPDVPDLSACVALLTGAARGIGLAIAQALAEKGCAIALQDVDLNEARSAAAQLPARAIALGGDISDPALADQLIQRTSGELGGLHILINNAGVQIRRNWLDTSLDDFDRQMRGNVYAPMRLAQLAAPIFRAQHFGRIINIGSIQATSGNERMLPYSMSKSALENMTKALARDFAKDNVTVNVIAPGYFDTARNSRQLSTPQIKADTGRRIPLGRLGEPADCAGLALYLCSPEGAYITGQCILIDGGLALP